MNHEHDVKEVEQEPKPAAKKELTMPEFIASLDGAPTAEQIATWKSQSPTGRIRAYAPDAATGGKRVYILRPLNGLEVSQIQKRISGMATPVGDADLEMQIASVVTACLWTNAGTNGKLTDVVLRTGAAGTPSSLFAIVTELSDFADPQKLEFLSADL